jgi:hypothetical protein
MLFVYLAPKLASLFWGEITCLKACDLTDTLGFGGFLVFEESLGS